jgi:hypothetical protein
MQPEASSWALLILQTASKDDALAAGDESYPSVIPCGGTTLVLGHESIQVEVRDSWSLVG